MAMFLGIVFGSLSSSKNKVLKIIARVYVEYYQNIAAFGSVHDCLLWTSADFKLCSHAVHLLDSCYLRGTLSRCLYCRGDSCRD